MVVGSRESIKRWGDSQLMSHKALLAVMMVLCILFVATARVDGQQPAGLAGSAWSGHEGLQGYGALVFRFSAGGTAHMTDTDGTTRGTWTKSGNSVTLKFYSDKVIYNGTISSGFRMRGTATNGKRTWNWWVLKPTTDLESRNRARPVQAAKRSKPTDRRQELLNEVIDQFHVENNPRYMREKESDRPFCNIFVSDVTRALGAEIPHWVKGKELDTEGMRLWLNNQGKLNGWRRVSAAEAQRNADEGRPSIVYGPGHIAVVRPGGNPSNPAIAQAGNHNYNRAQVSKGWPPNDVPKWEYFIHD
jgi:hypothetical protein